MANRRKDFQEDCDLPIQIDERDRHFLQSARLVLPEQYGVDRQINLLRQLGKMEKSCKWWIADFVLWRKRYQDKQERLHHPKSTSDDPPEWAAWESVYTWVAGASGLERQTVENIAYVARNVPPDRRRGDTLSFSHHAEVAGMDAVKQVFWLTIAERDELSVAKLRHRIKTNNPMGEGCEISGRALHRIALSPKVFSVVLQRLAEQNPAKTRTAEKFVEDTLLRALSGVVLPKSIGESLMRVQSIYNSRHNCQFTQEEIAEHILQNAIGELLMEDTPSILNERA
jgi:hypothetical protein